MVVVYIAACEGKPCIQQLYILYTTCSNLQVMVVLTFCILQVMIVLTYCILQVMIVLAYCVLQVMIVILYTTGYDCHTVYCRL